MFKPLMSVIIAVSAVIWSQPALAQTKWNHALVDPIAGHTVTLIQVLQSISPGTVVVIGEMHGNKGCHEHQQLFLKHLNEVSPDMNISVGMEHFDYPNQKIVDAYLNGMLSETDMLRAVNWGKLNFDHYRQQVLFPKYHGGQTYALNLPRTISHRISQVGLANLSPDEAAFLPARLQLGNRRYWERFVASMGGHGSLPPAQLQRYFEAQSAWDDTMAAKTVEALKNKKDQVIVILTGNFHAEYFGGLPDRLRARGVKKLLVIPQLIASEYTASELMAHLRPDPIHGPLGDLIWVVGEPRPKFAPFQKRK
jgi:uncharacterized iron-regulated protein